MQKLQPLLSEYLVETGSLPLAGVGHFTIEQQAPARQVGETIEPPRYEVVFTKGTPSEKEWQHLSQFVSKKLSISQQQVAQLLDPTDESRPDSLPREDLVLQPFGRFSAGEKGELSFRPEADLSVYLPTILLPQQTPESSAVATPQPMEETVEPEPASNGVETEKKNYWWVWALVILTASALLILFRYL